MFYISFLDIVSIIRYISIFCFCLPVTSSSRVLEITSLYAVSWKTLVIKGSTSLLGKMLFGDK